MTTNMSAVTQKGQYLVESTYGGGGAALKIFAGLGISISPRITFDELKRMGYRWPSLESPGQIDSVVRIAGKPCYPDLPTIFSCVHKTIPPTTPGGGTLSRLWTAVQSSTDEDDVSSLVVEQGNKKLARRAKGVILSGYNISGDTQKVNFTAEGFGKGIETGIRLSTSEVQTIAVTGSPAGGDFTVTVTDPDTLATTPITIVYNSTSTQAQTAFNTAIGAGNSVITGTDLPGGLLTVTFIGRYGSRNIATMTKNAAGLTGGTSPDVTIATVTPGVAPTEGVALDIQANHVEMFYDSVYGSIGTTKIDKLYSWALGIGSMRVPHYVVDRLQNGAPIGHLEDTPTGTFDAKINANETADAIYDDAINGRTGYILLNARGSLIEGSLYNYAQWKLAVKVKNVGEDGPEGAAWARSFQFGLVHDPTMGGALIASAQTTTTAI